MYLLPFSLQYLFENGRVENIFMDRFYNNFSMEFTKMLKGFKPLITARGEISIFLFFLSLSVCVSVLVSHT